MKYVSERPSRELKTSDKTETKPKPRLGFDKTETEQKLQFFREP